MDDIDWSFVGELALFVGVLLVGFVLGWLVGRSDTASGRG